MDTQGKFTYRVLIVHDDLRIIDLLKRYFPKEQFNLMFAYDGLEGIQKVRDFDPHCIITKAYLARINGLMMTRIIKFDKRYEHIPVIMLLSGITTSLKGELQKVRVNMVILEPFHQNRILKAVVNLVYSSRLHRQTTDKVII